MAQATVGQIWHFNAKKMASLCLVASAFALLAACSSTKLNEASVEDKSGKPVAVAPGAAGAGNEMGSRAVQPGAVESSTGSVAGPASMAKVIYFDYDSYAIKPEFQNALDAHARFMGANKTRKMAIEGHTDERGGREYNLALGQKRAEAVRQALGLLGVTDAQVEAVSFGKEKPAQAGSDEASWALNRRAEINYR
jgi:peptidoglycan-associated lipoprotein